VDVGPCTNNYLVAQRFLDCDELDEQLDYVFTFRMAPTPVRLRMLAVIYGSRGVARATYQPYMRAIAGRRRALMDPPPGP